MGRVVEAVFDQLRPILDAENLNVWRESDVSTLLSLLDEYYKAQRKKKLRRVENPAKNKPLEMGEGGEREHVKENDDDEGSVVDLHLLMGDMDRSLTQLRRFLQQRVPYGLACEPNKPPCSTSAMGCDGKMQHLHGEIRAPVYSVDAFLYLEEDVDELAERGCISREYCKACGSCDIGLSEFITHSFSQDQLVYLSCYLLPALGDASYGVTPDWFLRLRDKPVPTGSTPPFSPRHVVDVGSRLGSVLLSCYFATQQQRLTVTSRVTGVELDNNYITVQQNAINRFATNPETLQLDVVHSNCLEGSGADALRSADVVVLHNVFEYFTETPEEHLRSWKRLRKIVARRGQLLICSPSLQETFSLFNEEDIQTALIDDQNGANLGAFSAGESQNNTGSSCRKRSRASEEGSGSVHERWLQSWVREIDVSEVRDAFLLLRQETEHFHDDHSSCSEENGETVERLCSMRVYVVN